ncbi:MAG: sigma-70 family RNA polymerase sigma factor [Synechococcales cyanobacterium C42_A2020_086]|jgi:RNA polymerase sigma-70 factor (ECF subfamily)|nr:sigma-70 family RNA polymerase sigma factor [Synechococcales cyanobacterium C42_A2020_086]
MDLDSSALDPTAPPSPSDLDLLLALKGGEVASLATLYDRYAKLVFGLAFKILENSEEAEDVTQDVFLTLWRRSTYDPARGSLSSFLTTMTRSRAIDKLRARGSRLRFLQRWQGVVRTEASAATPLEHASLGERSQLVRGALAQLPESERRILEIAYYEGLSQSEIAKRLNIPLGTVKTRSRQGLLKLRKTLQDYI